MRFSVLFFLICSLQLFGQITKQWVQTFNGHGDFNDRFTCLTTDINGNIIAAGSSTNPGADRDFLICKFLPSGTLVWSKTINGKGSGTDEATAIATDSQNNIYVTGFAKGYNTSTDYFTLKLNSSGDTLWSKSYDFVAEYDQANSIALDNSGNIYVTGQSDSDPGAIINDDYLTIKYDNNGQVLWTKRFNGNGNAIDRAVKIIVDINSNSYLTGRSNNGTDDDFVTIKYGPTGNQIWIKFDDRGGWDRPADLKLDNANNLYICGKSQNTANYDFWLLKYNTAGVAQFQKIFDFVDDDAPTAMCIDLNNNVYLCGSSDADPTAIQNLDFQTVAYSATGQLLWQKRLNGSGNLDDIPNAICISGNNAMVSGTALQSISNLIMGNGLSVTYALNNGTQIWTNEFAGNPNFNDEALSNAAFGSTFYVAGFSEDSNKNRNAFIQALAPSGSQTWSEYFNGIGDNNENLRSISVDGNNNVHAAGYTVQRGANRNLLYLQINANGVQQCTDDWDGTAIGSNDDAQGITIGNNGQIIIAGFLRNKSTSNDIEILSFNPSLCDTNWTKTIDGIGHGSDKIYDLTKDANGFFYATGRQDVDPSGLANDNCYTVKFDQNGIIIWEKLFNSSGINEDRGEHIQLSTNGNVYVLGKTSNGLNDDILLLKYDGLGNLIWSKIINGGQNDAPCRLKIDGNENIYLLSNKESAIPGSYDIQILKYNSAGQLIWSQNYDGGNDDQAVSFELDELSNIIVLGHYDSDSNPNAINYDIICLKYDVLGNQIWQYQFDGTAHSDDIGDDIALSPFGNIYFTGHTNKSDSLTPNYDIVTMILEPSGSLLWSDIHNGISDSSDVPNIILINGNDFYIAGSTVEQTQMRNTLLIKYSGTVGQEELTSVDPNVLVFPNPFKEKLQIILPDEMTIEQSLDFEIYDLFGRLIKKEMISCNNTTISNLDLNEGFYSYRIKQGNSLIQEGKILHY